MEKVYTCGSPRTELVLCRYTNDRSSNTKQQNASLNTSKLIHTPQRAHHSLAFDLRCGLGLSHPELLLLLLGHFTHIEQDVQLTHQ